MRFPLRQPYSLLGGSHILVWLRGRHNNPLEVTKQKDLVCGFEDEAIRGFGIGAYAKCRPPRRARPADQSPVFFEYGSYEMVNSL